MGEELETVLGPDAIPVEATDGATVGAGAVPLVKGALEAEMGGGTIVPLEATTEEVTMGAALVVAGVTLTAGVEAVL